MNEPIRWRVLRQRGGTFYLEATPAPVSIRRCSVRSPGHRNRSRGTRSLGLEPTDREHDKLGYDIESRIATTGALRFIEVKGPQERRRDHHAQ